MNKYILYFLENNLYFLSVAILWLIGLWLDYFLFGQVFDSSFFILVLCRARFLCIWFDCSCFKCLFRGFTKFSRADYLKYKSESRIVPDGVNAKVMQSSTCMGIKFYCMFCSSCLKTFICLFIFKLGSGFVWSMLCIQLIYFWKLFLAV